MLMAWQRTGSEVGISATCLFGKGSDVGISAAGLLETGRGVNISTAGLFMRHSQKINEYRAGLKLNGIGAEALNQSDAKQYRLIQPLSTSTVN